MLRTILIVVSIVLAGCAATPVTTTLEGRCLKSNNTAYLWDTYDNVYVGKHLIAGKNVTRLTDKKKSSGVIDKGTKFKVKQVLRGSNGSFGSFYRVSVEIVSGPFAGELADLPACVPYHPSSKWVLGCSDLNKLAFNPEKVSECI